MWRIIVVIFLVYDVKNCFLKKETNHKIVKVNFSLKCSSVEDWLNMYNKSRNKEKNKSKINKQIFCVNFVPERSVRRFRIVKI